MNPLCPRCGAGNSVRHGRYHRYDDAQSIQRYLYKLRGKCHSSVTLIQLRRAWQSGEFRLQRRSIHPVIKDSWANISGNPLPGASCSRLFLRPLSQISRMGDYKSACFQYSL